MSRDIFIYYIKPYTRRSVNVEFIICDDEKIFRGSIKRIIEKIMIKNDEDYHIREFEKYDTNFEQTIIEKKPKIYILDIEIKNSISGIDIARKIRKNDWESIIILVTSHNELGFQALKAQIMLLDFISKYDNLDKNVEKTIKKAISLINSKKTINFIHDRISYIVHIKDILYVEKDSIERKCIIKTNYNDIYINKTLTNLLEELDDRFYQSHRSCLINTERIHKIDWGNNIIHFDNGDYIDLLARNKKKGLKEYVGS